MLAKSIQTFVNDQEVSQTSWKNSMKKLTACLKLLSTVSISSSMKDVSTLGKSTEHASRRRRRRRLLSTGDVYLRRQRSRRAGSAITVIRNFPTSLHVDETDARSDACCDAVAVHGQRRDLFRLDMEWQLFNLLFCQYSGFIIWRLNRLFFTNCSNLFFNNWKL